MGFFTKYILIIIISGFFCRNLHSQTSIPNRVIPLKIEKEIKLDGVLDEDCWKQAMRISNFSQVEPKNGEEATERTEFAVCYTNSKLYIGVWCYDRNPEDIIRKGMKRDFADWRDDIFAIGIDTYREMNSGYIFEINPNGARWDAQVAIYGNNESWNGIWDDAVTVNSEGWFGEIEIPFSTLKFPDKPYQQWGFNVGRIIMHKNEKVRWQGWSANNNLSTFRAAGLLDSLINIKGKETLELKPYVLAGADFTDEKTKSVGKIGGDVNYQINPNIKLNMTFNTDFAQVESDELKINLTRFSLYYPEKRDFFLEGSSNFSMTLDGESDIFYSRRIGIHDESIVPILAGAKVLGRIDNTTLGLMSIQTGKTGNIGSTNYSIFKFDRQFSNTISVSGIGTAINRNDFYNYVYGGNFMYSTNNFLGNNNLIIDGLAAQSQTKDGLNNRNNVFTLYAAYPNELLNMEFLFNQTQNNFDPQLGFLQRKNIKRAYGEAIYRPRPNWDGVKRLSFKLFDYNLYWTDETNQLESATFSIKPFGIELSTEDYFGFEIYRRFDRLDEDFQLSDDFIIPAGEYWFNTYALEINTFSGRKMTNWIWAEYGNYYDADFFNLYATLAWNINKHLNISGEYSYNRLERESAKFFSNSIMGRIDYAVNPKANTGLFAQWNDEIDQLIVNFRVSIIPVIGSDIYFVVNQTYTDLKTKMRLEDTAVLLKIVWRFGV
jgi:hypothetical protein